jgi:signal transduction histidine kinase
VRRFRPSPAELGIAAGSAALAYVFAWAAAPGAVPVASIAILAATLLGALTAADRPDRAGLFRAAIACAIGVFIGNLGPGGIVRASLLVLVFMVGRVARMVPLERRESADRAAAAVAEERARIARDLHDVIAHSLGVVVVQVQAAERIMDTDPDKARAALNAAASVGRDALDDMHRMVGVMRGGPGRIEAQPTLADVSRLVEQTRLAGLAATLETDAGLHAPGLAPGVEVAVYRIVQEALANAAHHAVGGRVDVRIAQRPDSIEVEVADTGGRARGDAGGGFGIAGMRERAAVYGGTVDAGPRLEGGFLVRARIPVKGS